MPEQRVTREAVLDAALAVVREQGEAALSARSVAQRAGCSVQPIYSLFGDMGELVRQLYGDARAWVAAYDRLYLSPHMEATGFKDVYESVAIDGVQACIEELGNLSPEAARELYLDMIVYVHGMAAMLATGAQLSDEELRERMDRAFRGFVALVRA